MKTQIVCLGGWGFNHHVFDELMSHLDVNLERININTSILEPIHLKNKVKIILTWSFGYLYFLDHIDKFTNVKCVIALSPTSRMIYDKDYAFAWPKKIIDKMAHDLENNYKQTIKKFYKNCSNKDLSDYYISSDESKKVIESLNLLTNLDLRQVDNPYPSLLIHGDMDKVIHYKHSEYMHKELKESIYYKISGKHFILENKEVIKLVTEYIRGIYD